MRHRRSSTPLNLTHHWSLYPLLGLLLGATAMNSCSADVRAVDQEMAYELPSQRFQRGCVSARVADLASPGTLQLWVMGLDGEGQPSGERARMSKGGPAPAVLGKNSMEGERLVFEPRFALQPGLWYLGEYTQSGRDEPAQLSFQVEAVTLRSTTQVTRVFPSADVLPENLLRFYLNFSAPMRRGEAYGHIRILDEEGAEVPGVFLNLKPELWDPEARRLTLLLDPGRIKRGLGSLEEQGPNLQEGASYTLQIDRHWRDAKGAELSGDFAKSFDVVAADRRSPDQNTWRLSSPTAGSREALRVEFDEPIDHALLQHMLQVVRRDRQTSDGDTLGGQGRVLAGEQVWEWTPAEPWRVGPHNVRVDPLLEDRAGNGLLGLFDDVPGTFSDAQASGPILSPFECLAR